MASDAQTPTLSGSRFRPSVTDIIGLSLVALLLIILFINFLKTPADFINLFLIGMTVGMVYALIALGYSLVYGILELINFAHGDVFMLGAMMCVTLVGAFGIEGGQYGKVLVLIVPMLLDLRGLLRHAERHDRDDRLPAAAQRAPAGPADHGDRRELHPPERRPRLEGPGAREHPGQHPPARRDLLRSAASCTAGTS